MSEYLVDVHGLRTFRVSDDGQLLPVIALDDSWRGGVCIATCRRTAAHQAPVDRCRCGIYTFRSLPVLRAQYEQAEHLVAVVALEGQTLAGSRGWRSQAGRVLDLWIEPGALPEPLLAALVGNLPDVVFHQTVDAMVSRYPDLSLQKSMAPGNIGLVRRPAQLVSVQLRQVTLSLLATVTAATLFLFAGDSRSGPWAGLSSLMQYVGANFQDLFFLFLILALWIRARRLRGKPPFIATLIKFVIPIVLGAGIAYLIARGAPSFDPLFVGYAVLIGWLELWQFAYAVGRTDGSSGIAARRFLHGVRQVWRVLRPSRRHTGVNFCAHTLHPISAYPLVMPVHFETGPDPQ